MGSDGPYVCDVFDSTNPKCFLLHRGTIFQTHFDFKLHVRNYHLYFTFPLQFTSKYENMFIMSGLISVDTFFVMSGLLVSVNLLKHLEKTYVNHFEYNCVQKITIHFNLIFAITMFNIRGGRINILVLYFHRYLRLTPLLVVSILFSTTIMQYLGSGPLWPGLIEMFRGQCQRNWLSTLLYVQNYANANDVCFGHSWYLSVDTQLFVISPFVMYLIYKFKSKAVFGLSVMVFGCIGCTISTFLVENFEGIDL